jgi:predicted aspartyl protease
MPAPLAALRSSVGASVPQAVFGSALIDTGANFEAIDPQAAAFLLLRPSGLIRTVGHGGGTTEAALSYVVAVSLCEFDAGLWEVTSVPLKHLQLVAVIGTSFLKRCMFALDGPRGSFVLSWT